MYGGLLKTDELIELLDMCKKQQDGGNPFVHDIRVTPELCQFLAFDSQLHNIHRFCANNYCFSILGVDPTYNLCGYNVTITTYRHPLLLTETNAHSVLIGPVTIH